MATFAELLVRIGGDATGFTQAMDGVASKTTAVVAQTEQKLTGLAGVFSGLGGKMAAGIGFAALGASIVSVAEKFESAGFTLRRATGATGADLEALEKSFTNLYTTSARSAEEISSALATIKVETKLSGAALEDLTRANLAFAKVTGTDVKSAIESTQSVFKNWNISVRDQSAALEILYKVIQETHISSGALTSQLAAAGPVVRTLGLSFVETAALVGNMEERGLNAERVFAALNIGFKKLAKDSADPKQALFDLIEKMKGMEDQTKSAALAAPIFGRGALVLADAVKRGAFDVQDFTAALDKNKDSLRKAASETESVRNEFVKFQHQLEATVGTHKDLIVTAGLAVPALATLGGAIKGVIGAANVPLVAGAGILGLFGATVIAGIYATIKGLDDLEKKYDSLEKRQKGGVEYTPETSGGEKPWDKFTGEAAMAGIEKFTLVVSKATDATELHAEAIKRLKEEQKRLNDAVSDAQLKYDAVARAYNKGEASARQLADAHVKLTNAQNAASPEKLIEWHQKQNDEYLKWSAKMSEVTGKSDVMRAHYQDFVNAVNNGDVDRRLMEISATSELLGKNLANLKIPDSLLRQADAANDGTRELSEAFKSVGIETDRSAAKVQQAYERIRDSGVATAHEILVAERAAIKARIEEHQAAGEAVSEADRKRYAELETILSAHVKTQKTLWTELIRDLTSAFSQFNRDVAGIFMDTLAGDGEGSVWSRIGTAFKTMLKNMGASIVEFGIEYLEKKLFKWFLDLTDNILPGVGNAIRGALGGVVSTGTGAVASAIPGLPGAISGASSTVAGAGSSAAGATGAAASSAAAWVGVAATAIGTAITALGQAKMEGTLNAIEKEARYAQIHLYYLLERANLYWPKLDDIQWYLWNRQDKWLESFDDLLIKSESHMESILKILKDDIKPWVEKLLWIAQNSWEQARVNEAAIPAAITAAVAPLVDAIEGAMTGAGENASATGAPTAGVPMAPGKSLAQSLFDLAAIVARRPSMKYGGPDWLETMRSMQEGTLANALKGFDPNNPMGYAPTAAAYAENTGPAYQAWLTGAVGNTKDMLSKWATWIAAVVEAQKAVAGAVVRQQVQANINVFLNGRQVGNAMVEDLALMGVTM